MYEYQSTIVRIIDGDTVDVDIDLGFDVWLKGQRIRIKGIDTPETRTTDLVEKIFGEAAKARVIELLKGTVILKTEIDKEGKDARGKYGRILGDFYIAQIDGTFKLLSEILVEEGHAVKYFGQNKADVYTSHLANRNLLMETKKVDVKSVQDAQSKMNKY